MKAYVKNSTLLAALLAGAFCGNREPVRLTVDFSSQREWRYTLSVDMRGDIATADARRGFSSNARCCLLGRPVAGEPATLHISACSVSIAAPLLSDAEKTNLARQCNEAKFTVDVGRGTIMPDDPDDMPLVKIGEWDLYKDVGKVLPALPQGRVRKGYSWEREKLMPLETKRGGAVGHLLQSFTLDSIFIDRQARRAAMVSWRFTYGVEVKSADASGRLSDVPTKGSGQGSALLNISDKTLEKASIHFSVPSTREGKITISWKENIELTRQK